MKLSMPVRYFKILKKIVVDTGKFDKNPFYFLQMMESTKGRKFMVVEFEREILGNICDYTISAGRWKCNEDVDYCHKGENCPHDEFKRLHYYLCRVLKS